MRKTGVIIAALSCTLLLASCTSVESAAPTNTTQENVQKAKFSGQTQLDQEQAISEIKETLPQLKEIISLTITEYNVVDFQAIINSSSSLNEDEIEAFVAIIKANVDNDIEGIDFTILTPEGHLGDIVGGISDVYGSDSYLMSNHTVKLLKSFDYNPLLEPVV